MREKEGRVYSLWVKKGRWGWCRVSGDCFSLEVGRRVWRKVLDPGRLYPLSGWDTSLRPVKDHLDPPVNEVMREWFMESTGESI